jgi:hypothetical protein
MLSTGSLRDTICIRKEVTMVKNIIGHFDPLTAERVIGDLRRSGLTCNLVHRFERGEDDLYEELLREGIPDDEATYYVDGLSQGARSSRFRPSRTEWTKL